MKRFLAFIITLLIFTVTSSKVFAENNFTIMNNANLSDWSRISGNSPLLHYENDEIDGITLSGSSDNVLFDYKYNKELLKNEIMLDFLLDDTDINYDNKPKISFIYTLDSDSTEFCSFIFDIFNDSYDATVVFGDKELYFNSLKYKENGHIQFRIAKDDILNRETGEYQNAWNLVLGIQKKTVTTKNDSYSIKENKFDDESFVEIDNYLESFNEFEYVNLEIKATSLGLNNCGMKVTQICDNNFYNCYVFSNDLIEYTDVNYTSLKMTYEIPDNNFVYNGFLIKRYKNGEYDCTFQYTNKYANSLTEKYLVQNTEYTYEICALEQVSSSNRVACSKIIFKYEAKPVTTKAGNPIYLVYGIAVFLFLVMIFIFSYVYRFEIAGFIKKIFVRS